MATRKLSATVDLKVRMKEPLRARLEKASAKRGISMNAEAVDRLERSFNEDDSWGGPEILNMARLMAAAFIRGGQGARHPQKAAPADWINDPAFYEVAAETVYLALIAAQPVHRNFHGNERQKKTGQKIARTFARIKARGIAKLAAEEPGKEPLK